MSPDTLSKHDIPVSMRGLSISAIAFMAGVIGILLAWSLFAPLHAGALAPGEIIPAGRTKTVQHLDGGIVRQIFVKDGDRVQAGQPLLQLDEVEARAQLAIVSTDAAAQRALVDRLIAERDGKPLPPPQVNSPSMESQYRILEARRSMLLKEIEGAEQRIRDAQTELSSWRRKEESLKALASNAAEEFRINQDLYQNKFISHARLLELKNRLAATEAALEENNAEAARARQRITESEIAIAKLKAEWINAILEDLRRAQDALAAAQARVEVAEARVARTQIIAPQAGIVNGLRFTTVGGVIPPGGEILEVTPVTDQLVVEAKLSPDEIDLVRVGLPVRVRLTAYRARWHFALNGKVTYVSSDTFKDEKSGQSYFKVRAEIPESELVTSEKIDLVPGMLAQVEFITGERSAIRYLLDPIINSFDRAFKEK